MQNLFKNKLFIILFTLIFLTFVLCVDTFASYECSYSDYAGVSRTFTLSDELSSFPYVIAFVYHTPSYARDTIQILVSDYPFYKTSGGLVAISDNDYALANGGITFYSYSLISTNCADYGAFLEAISNLTISDLNTSVHQQANSTYISKGDIIFSNYDVYDYNNELVFQGAPLEVVPEITKILVEQTTQVGMKPLIQIKILLPIVIVTIVGLIGFWKASQLLLKNLRKA